MDSPIEVSVERLDKRLLAAIRLRAVAIRLIGDEAKYLSNPDANDLSLMLAALLLEAAVLLDDAQSKVSKLADGRCVDEVWPGAFFLATTEPGVKQ